MRWFWLAAWVGIAGLAVGCGSSDSGGTGGTAGSGTGGTAGSGTGGTAGSGTGGTAGSGTGGTAGSGTGGAAGSGTGGTAGSGTGGTAGSGTGGAAGSGGTCSAASDCPTPANECVTATCDGGQCGTSFVAAGTNTTNQTAGDCHVNQCDGAGNVTSVVDDNDVPDDSNACTTDVCTNGTPSHANVASGSTCGTNLYCDGNGNCVNCVAASDCGTDTPCKTFVCNGGTCSTIDVSPGTVVANPVVGDCLSDQCDGSGNISTNVADPSDVPADDGNQCTLEVCDNGAPAHPNANSGTACTQNGGVLCDGNGSCVQCLVASDCGTDTPCKTFACNGGMCSSTDVASGTVVANPTPGDCLSDQCDGSGNISTNVADPSDVPADDGNQCTLEVCDNGAPAHPNAPAGTPCTQSGVACDSAGTCLPAPVVVSTSPADGATVPASPDISVTFNIPMLPATLTGQTTAGPCSGSIQVSLDDFTSCIAFSSASAMLSNGDMTATLTPQPGLLVNRTYKIKVTTAAQGINLTPLAADYVTPNGFTTTSPNLCDGSLVISQIYGGGGSTSTSTVYKNDFVELHNRGTTTVDLTGLSLQYASATGDGWSVVALSGSVPGGGYFLVQLAGGSAGAALPTPDQSSTGISMSATSGKIALINGTAANPTGVCPPAATTIDFVGYGSSANCAEGTRMGVLSNTTAGFRVQGGCADGNDNSVDFVVAAPAPRNSATLAIACACIVQNESDTPEEAQYCDTQFPLSMSVAAGATTPNVYGRLYYSGVTGLGTPNANVRAQLGFGPLTANPEYEPGWTWTTAGYNVSCTDCGNNDEYQASFTAPAAGTWGYVYRFSLDQGVSWTYCDNYQGDMGAGSNAGLTFDLQNIAQLTSQ